MMEPATLPASPAHLARRAVAHAVDSAITLGISLASYFCCCFSLFSFSLRSLEPEWVDPAFWLSCCASLSLPYLFVVSYHTLQTAATGQTIGQWVAHIRTVANDGAKPSAGQALLRTLALSMSEVFFFLGYFMPLWDEKQQAWHDKVSGTYVVDNSP